jgi:predicted signal transduction protein with EAL and GGDEF domain
MVPPSRFVGVAEDTGLIVPIGAWVMRTACAQNKAWQEAGLGRLRVAVNLSARQFSATDLLPGIEAALRDTGLAPDCLELELTESLFMSDITPAVELLHRMKSFGVKLSIDDFGTGYSSLSYLSRFPIDVLKIDRSFVADITHDANDAAIVASIITLAHNLRLSVIAEGGGIGRAAGLPAPPGLRRDAGLLLLAAVAGPGIRAVAAPAPCARGPGRRASGGGCLKNLNIRHCEGGAMYLNYIFL